MVNNKKNRNAGRQAQCTGNPFGFREGASSRPGPSGEPANWICLLRGMIGRGLRLRIGGRSFRLSSDTIYFLEERGGDRFTYVCGTPDAVVRTLQDLRRRSGHGPRPAAEPESFGAVWN